MHRNQQDKPFLTKGKLFCKNPFFNFCFLHKQCSTENCEENIPFQECQWRNIIIGCFGATGFSFLPICLNFLILLFIATALSSVPFQFHLLPVLIACSLIASMPACFSAYLPGRCKSCSGFGLLVLAVLTRVLAPLCLWAYRPVVPLRKILVYK